MAESSAGGSSGFEQINPARQDFAWQVNKQEAVQGVTSANVGQMGVSGGNTTGGVVRAPETPVASWGNLGTAIDNLIAPKLKQQQQEEFWKGVTQARAGVAIKDIVDSDSPVNKIFGPSNYVQGAQFYTAQQRVADYSQNMVANADKIARLPPDQIGEELNKQSTAFQTGDPGTDALLHQTWVEQTAPALSVITKTRYALQQKDATSAWADNAMTQARALQSFGPSLTNGTASQGDYDQQRILAAGSLMIPPGMAPETYRAQLPQLARMAADQGNFHMVNLLKDSGALDGAQMPIKERVQLDDYIDKKGKAAAIAWRASVAKDTSDDTAALRAGAITPEQYQQRTQDRQKTFQNMTGNKEPLIPWAEQEGNFVSGRGNYWEAQKTLVTRNAAATTKAATQAEKDAADARAVQQNNAFISQGSAGDAIKLGVPATDITVQFNKTYNDYTPPERVQLLTSNYQNSAYVDPVVKNRLQQTFRSTTGGTEYTPAVETAYQDWKALTATPQGTATSAAYLDHDQTVQFQKFDMLRNSGLPPEIAYQGAFKDPLTSAVDYTKTHGIDKDVVSAVKDKYSEWFPHEQNLDDYSQRLVAGLVMKNVGTTMQNTGLTNQQASYQAMHNLKANGLETFGGMAWMKQPNQKPLESMISYKVKENGDKEFFAEPHEVVNEIFRKVAKDGIAAAGGKGDAYQVYRLPDVNDKANFAIVGYTKDGNTAAYQFDSDKITEALKANRTTQNQAQNAEAARLLKRQKENREAPSGMIGED